MKLVSVVMPVYNHEKYVEQALQSIFDQTYSELEVIVIDDGSLDSSVERIKEFLKRNPHRQVRFIEQNNQGAHNTINRGLSLATGEILTILNSDDFYSKDRIEKMVKFLEETKRDIAFSYVTWIDSEGRPVSPHHKSRIWYEGEVFKEIAIQPSVSFALLSGNLAVTTGNIIFTRKIFEKLGGFKSYRLAHDLDFLMRAVPDFEPGLLREPLLFYRVHDGNTITKYASDTEKELAQIYGDYLLKVEASPPSNELAPSKWYWPNFLFNYSINANIRSFLHGQYEKDAESGTRSAPALNSSCKEQILKRDSKYTLVSHELSLSGAPKLLADLAMSIKSQGAKVKVISLLDGPMRKVLEAEGIRVKVIPKSAIDWHHHMYKPARLFFFTYMTLFFFLNAKGTVLVNSAASWPLFPALDFYSRLKRVILYVHESISPFGLVTPGKMHGLLEKIAIEKTFEIWFGSGGTREIWRRAGFDGKVIYWSGLLKTQSEAGQLKSSTIHNLVNVGSAHSRKGTHYLVDAFIKCAKEHRIPGDMILTLVGFPAKIDVFVYDLIMKILLSGLKDRIKIVGALSPEKLVDYFRRDALYIQPSIMECLPISLLQAMSFGMPILSTDVDGCPEAIQNGINGYLCKSQNIEAMADSIEKIVKNPEEAFRYADKAKEDFDAKFSLEVTEMLKALAVADK
jgi:glycosyltransferase involved in cell wall biosynthesis